MNIVRRQDQGTNLPAPRGWDPVHVVRDMMRWDPFREPSPLFSAEEMKDVDVKETPNTFVFKADVPGMKEKNVEISPATGSR